MFTVTEKTLRLDWMISVKKGKEKDLRGHFWALSEELLNRI